MCMSPREKLLVHWCLLYNLATCTLPSTTLYYKGSRTCFPVLLSNTKLAKRACKYFFLLQSSQKVLPRTTLYCKACRRTSQYYSVVQSLQNVRPSITLYYKDSRTCFPVLLCTTRLAERAFQYYPVLQSLQNVLPSII